MVLYIIYHQVLGGGSGGSLPQNDGRFGGVAAAGRVLPRQCEARPVSQPLEDVKVSKTL